jgi:hypothetical protein
VTYVAGGKWASKIMGMTTLHIPHGPTLRAHRITIPNRLGKCLPRPAAGSLDIVPWHAISAMQEFLPTIDRQEIVTLLHNRTRSRLRSR